MNSSRNPEPIVSATLLQLLPFPALSYFIFSGSGFCLRVLLSLSCISYHVILCIAFAYVFISYIRAFSPLSVLHSGASFSSGGLFLSFFRVWGLNISGLDLDLPSSLGLLPVDRLSSFVPFGLHLMLQRLTEGLRRPRVCCSPTPSHFGPKPSLSSRVFDHDRVAENHTSFGLP